MPLPQFFWSLFAELEKDGLHGLKIPAPTMGTDGTEVLGSSASQ
jgi:hypothetical protein